MNHAKAIGWYNMLMSGGLFRECQVDLYPGSTNLDGRL